MAKARLPGFAECMQMMRKHDPQVQEEGFNGLRSRAAELVEPLLAEYEHEPDHGIRCWLLELLGDARDPRTLPVFLEAVRSRDESFRSWAVRGLKLLGTPEARKALFEVGEKEAATPTAGSERRPRDR
jgi:hypothetical protein